MKLVLALALLLGIPPQEPARVPSLAVTELRTEAASEPLAVTSEQPRLSWQLVALDPARRGLRQTAYQVLVSRSLDALTRDVGDVLDTGKVRTSDPFLEIEWSGVKPFTHLWWKVRVYDQGDVASPWSAPAHFARGPGQDDWFAQWIGHDAPLAAKRREPDLTGTTWLTAGDSARELWLRGSFELDSTADLKAAVLVAAVDEYEFFVNGKSVGRGAWKSGLRAAELHRVSPLLRTGTNVLAARVRRKSDGPAALCAKLVLESSGGNTREIVSGTSWRVQRREETGWNAPEFAAEGWNSAQRLGDTHEDALGAIETPSIFLPPPRLLRGSFEAHEKPARATLYASALGLVSLELNGARVEREYFVPGWTDYTQRVPYRAFDVTPLVAAGENALGAVLADGWYAGFLGKRGKRDNYGSKTRLLAQLELEFADGSHQRVVSDASWKATVGPWLEADFYMGERFDARRALLGWSRGGFPLDAWSPVDVGIEHPLALTAHDGQPIELLAELAPVALTRDPAGRWIFDFGQNFAGVVRLDVEAPAGTNVLLRFGERLEKDGSLFRKNLGFARSADLYICRGGARELWTPRFTYHGFRYVELSGLPSEPTRQTLTGLALSAATRDVGAFACSDETINRLVELARWSLRSNAMDVPTDCPQRGERLGWLADAQLFAPSALWLADLERLYAKWRRDLIDALRPDGTLPAVAPAWDIVGSGGPGWDEALSVVEGLLLERAGSLPLTPVTEEQLARFRQALIAEYAGPERPEGAAAVSGYGDWNARVPTPLELLELAYDAKTEQFLSRVDHLQDLPEWPVNDIPFQLRARFERDWLTPEGEPRVKTQTALALALTTGLAPESARARIGQLLVADLAEQGMTTGFLGTAELFPALSSLGRTDLGIELLRKPEVPGYGSLVARGATTLWERMDGWTEEHGVANGGFTSFNHTPFGTYVAWLFEHVAGIKPATPGFATIAFEPEPTHALEWAEARHLSPRGELGLRWEWQSDALLVTVLVPPNTDASLRLPGATVERMDESGRPLAEAEGVHGVALGPGGLLLGLASGEYRFRLKP
jgi:alpha-L-rhamnosidase